MAEDKPNPHEHPLPPRAETAAESEQQPEVQHADGRIEHPWIRYEKTDARFSGVVLVMAVVAVIAAVQFVLVLKFYHSQEQAQAELKKSSYPLAPGSSGQLPLEPRLEQIDRLKGVARENVYRREAAKEAVLHSYGDTSDEGFVHIPVERAMQLVVDQLKSRTKAPAEPVRDNGLVDSGESNSGRLLRKEPRW
ncbi:MAG TPA: hypothetical protein VG433_04635 [Pirellulales bacterium]|jgi:hypothetical protein|nr:hypothetical protein [Pirellulales bacterium]